jgi:dTDP-4-dehydrorhamnose 3,5-epimerase-like enzyme
LCPSTHSWFTETKEEIRVITSQGEPVYEEALTIIELADSGDARGRSFPVIGGWLTTGFVVRDTHVSTILPGSTRGNHYHLKRNEVLLVMFEDRWSFHWDNGPNTLSVSRGFTRPGAVLLQVPRGTSHAIHNDGTQALNLVGLTDGPFDPAAPDAFPRKVFQK